MIVWVFVSYTSHEPDTSRPPTVPTVTRSSVRYRSCGLTHSSSSAWTPVPMTGNHANSRGLGSSASAHARHLSHGVPNCDGPILACRERGWLTAASSITALRSRYALRLSSRLICSTPTLSDHALRAVVRE